MQIWSAEIKEIETLYVSLKGQFPDLEKEVERLINAGDENMVLVYARRFLEVIITDLCENELKRPRKTEPLQGIIDKLNREEKVPSHIIVSMQYLNSLSTFGAHPKDFDPEQVKPVLSNLVIIFKWYLKYKTEKDELAGKEKDGEHQSPLPLMKKRIETKEPDHAQKPKKSPYIFILGILLMAVIIMLVFNLFDFFRKDKFEDIRDPDGKISIAVMPFENLTGDTTLNWFQRGISSLIINGLGNSPELSVRDDHTMFEVMESMNQVYTAGISPSIAKEVAKKVHAETYISGSYQGKEDKYWILVNLVNTENGDIIWTNKVEGDLKSSGYLDMADSLCNEIKNYLEIKALENVTDFDFREAYPKSAEAYRYFIEGMNSILTRDTEAAIQSLKKALEIDSTFTFASFYIAWAYSYSSQWGPCIIWTEKAYDGKDRLPQKYQPLLEEWYACYISKSLPDIIRYCNKFEESGINSRLLWYDLGVTYYGFPRQYDKAVKAFEKVEEISKERGGYWEYELFYNDYGEALHKVGNHNKEKEMYEIGLSLFPDSKDITYNQAICDLSLGGDTAKANKYVTKHISIIKGQGYSDASIEKNLGAIYAAANIIDKAEEHIRNAYDLEPQNSSRIFQLAYFLINNDINVDEGMAMVQKGLDIYPDNNGLLAVKGLGYYKQGKYDEALELYRRVEEKLEMFSYELNQGIKDAEQALANKNK